MHGFSFLRHYRVFWYAYIYTLRKHTSEKKKEITDERRIIYVGIDTETQIRRVFFQLTNTLRRYSNRRTRGCVALIAKLRFTASRIFIITFYRIWIQKLAAVVVVLASAIRREALSAISESVFRFNEFQFVKRIYLPIS